ncbi:DNA repair protein RadC [Bacillus wiedmannii]|jgi:DNA repair protein RadC|uniref:JAB domain-containing protein n=1 Tax=Bacillus cereus group TaxID=86661 RepID=UPI000279FE7F|nr:MULTISPECIES: JAB domain-containing protein [Bacillus cereus group]EJR08205.1 DNA repair protein RadC [Bacillus cereus MSX-D12]PFZ33008.1 DNA repair protein RadC [Bacillus wiedmannii]PGK15242.1 DNA repair protein RadC [Bacillus cereus]PGM79913.1 DNA repair protein RadC [Bacillus cereus]
MEKIFEIVRIKQVITELEDGRFVIHSPSDARHLASKLIGEDDREIFLVMCLNTKNQVVAVHRCHVGALNYTVVHAREVFKSAILNNSASIIVAHQHPTGNIYPSREDIEVSKKLVEAGKILGIEVLDSLIVNHTTDFYSMKDERRI